MWRAAYTALFALLLPLALVRLWWRGRREPGYRRRVGERLAYYREHSAERPRLWLHAVSVGEARASAGLVRALAAENPGTEMLVTCTTAAGRDALKELHGEAVRISWLPYDLPGTARRFIEHFRPRLGILVETEIWPNLLVTCREYGVPVVLANARMSAQSAAGYERWRSIAQPALASLAAVCAQSAEDAQRLQALGAVSVTISGNLKFDSAPDEQLAAEGRAWRARLGRPVLLLASTREGEEKLLLDALRAAPPETLVLVVPRHPSRFNEVAALAAKDGARAVSRRSAQSMPAAGDRVHLGDTMGEMDFYYAAADVAVIGGSFVPRGGQNLIEACAAGTPVILGPSMFNFSEATRLAVEAGAAVQVANAQDAASIAFSLLQDKERKQAMGNAGKKLCEAHRGATRRHLEACRALLATPGPG